MNLRLRLIVAFFLLSVAPLAAVTLYTYASNASAIRDAAGREAEQLAGDLTDRMKLVTAQLSQQFEKLMEIPTSAQPTAVSSASAAVQTQPHQEQAGASATATPNANADERARVARQLGEVAMLLNNIEVHGFGRGRGGFGGRRGLPNDGGPFGPPGGERLGPPGPLPANPDGTRGPNPSRAGGAGPRDGRGRPGAFPPPPPGTTPISGSDPSASAGGLPASGELNTTDGSGQRGFTDTNGGRPGRGGGNPGLVGDGRRSGGPPQPADPSRIQIDLGPMRREILQQIFPDRERWDQLSPEERELILTKVNERMLGIQQGIEILQQKASEQAADARIAATEAESRSPASATTAPPAISTRTARTPVQVRSAPPRSAASATAKPGAMQRQTALSGSRIDVRVMQDGEVVGQVKADINLPNLLATVFTSTRRDQGEVPFAVDRSGRIYTPTDADHAAITALDTPASRPDTPPGTALLSDWVVVTTADPNGSGLKFGIARPLGGALDELRRLSARNAGLGLGLIGLALIGIVPLSSRLTRNLSRLSDGVNRIAAGDYHARVDVSSHDEIGRLAGAFNRMAADVERHQHAAVQQERLRRELELGRQIQHDMLPQSPFRLGLTEIRGVSVPASEVGGDFFNYFQTPSGKIALVVGDVSGKGVGAALLMANIQASLRTRLALGQDLASLAQELDIDIGASTPGAVYATLFVGLLDPVSRTLDYVNAGHNPQFVLRAGGGLERMESAGMPIGLLVGHGYTERRVSLAAGDVLFFYTDGCVEAENDSGEMFGGARLEALLTDQPAASTDDTLVRIEREVMQFRSGREPFDDATMMVVNVG